MTSSINVADICGVLDPAFEINDLRGGKAVPKYTKKTWGYELTFHNKEYCGKMLWFEHTGISTSMHLHAGKHETLIVAVGKLKLDILMDKKETEYILSQGEAWVMIPGMPHRLTALEEHTIIVEASTKDKENDSVRIG